MSGVLDLLEQTLRERRADPPHGSYSAELFADHERILRKIMEEAFEVTLELGKAQVDAARTAEEAADLLFHLLVGLVAVDVAFSDVVAVLDRRRK
jgi:phosphoribosyl-ATP pyrophosphohydrolase